MGLSETLKRRVTQTFRKKKRAGKGKGAMKLASKSETGTELIPPVPPPKDEQRSQVSHYNSEQGLEEKELEIHSSEETKEPAAAIKQPTEAGNTSTVEQERRGEHDAAPERLGSTMTKQEEPQDDAASVGSTDVPPNPPISRKEAQRPNSASLPSKSRVAVKEFRRRNSTGVPPVPSIPRVYLENKAYQSGSSLTRQKLKVDSDPSQDQYEETPDVRHTSNQTAVSEKSNGTVHHDPSKRCTSTLTTAVESRFQEIINPFSDQNTIERRSETFNCEENTESAKLSLIPRHLLSSDDGESGAGPSWGRSLARSSESAALQMPSRRTSRSSDSISRRILDRTGAELMDRKRSTALLNFNTSAEALGLNPLERTPRQASHNNSTDQTNTAFSSGSLLNRLRNAKSIQTLKRSKSVLRRMRTMANIKADFMPGTLKGKSLEEIARVGGESIINMPYAYSPGPLRLPTCIAATVSYLLENGPSTQYLYVNQGNQGVVTTLYSHFAKQVVGPVTAKDAITQTTRPIDFPVKILNIEGHPRKHDEYLYDVGALLRQFLSEIPGGILGSRSLFQVLKQIHSHKFTTDAVRKDPGRREYIRETSPEMGAKVRMIMLAVVALTTDMQLELICAVFGLLALTHEESTIREQFHTLTIHPFEKTCSNCCGYPKMSILASAFGPLLYDTSGFNNSDVLQQPITMGPGLVEDVMYMMIGYWRLIASQMRKWGVMTSVGDPTPSRGKSIYRNQLPDIVSPCLSCGQKLPNEPPYNCRNPDCPTTR
ncbi:hypothetical protein VTO42DRAFT_7851 [Malbranchea cinnamomea]